MGMGFPPLKTEDSAGVKPSEVQNLSREMGRTRAREGWNLIPQPEVDDVDNELSTVMLHTYTATQLYNL